MAPAKIDPEQEVIDQLLPQPELDFSKAPIPPKRGDWDDPYSIYKPERAKIGKQVLVLLALVLVGVVGLGALKLGVVDRLTKLVKKTKTPQGQANNIATAAKPAEIVNKVVTPSSRRLPREAPRVRTWRRHPGDELESSRGGACCGCHEAGSESCSGWKERDWRRYGSEPWR